MKVSNRGGTLTLKHFNKSIKLKCLLSALKVKVKIEDCKTLTLNKRVKVDILIVLSIVGVAL
jgi:hypothetical protein